MICRRQVFCCGTLASRFCSLLEDTFCLVAHACYSNTGCNFLFIESRRSALSSFLRLVEVFPGGYEPIFTWSNIGAQDVEKCPPVGPFLFEFTTHTFGGKLLNNSRKTML